jgi:predicted dehydrogenase
VTGSTDLLEPALEPPRPSDPARYGIGVVGTGWIVQDGHLPAYREAGYRVEAVFDLDREKAVEVAERFDIPRVCTTLEELLAVREIDIVDVAVPAANQPPIALAAVATGKNLLCQKPFAESLADAIEMVEAAEAAGVQLCVNQNMRYGSAWLALRGLVAAGWLGALRSAEIQVNVATHWHLYGDWLLPLERLDIMNHSLHYFDAIRVLLGDPETVYCRGLRHPAQKVVGETWTTALLEYPDDRLGVIKVDHNALDDQRDWFSRYRLDGIHGAARGTTWYLFEGLVLDRELLEYRAPAVTGGAWIAPLLENTGMPASFAATMAELMRAVETGIAAPNSGRDNLGTLRLAFAAYRSMEEHRPVALADVGS